ncbi:MAG: SpoIIE family protein phosphatase [Gemmataceae bacterium]
MPALVVVRGPNAGQRFPLDADCCIIGRQPDAEVYLESLAVSRHHARVVHETNAYFIEDLGSSNGTYLNGHRLGGKVQLSERDVLQIGPYEFQLYVEPLESDPPQIIRAQVGAMPSNHTLFAQNPATKLERMLQIAQDLGRNLDIDPMLDRLLDHLMGLFPQADRGMVLLGEGDHLQVRAQRTRHAPSSNGKFGYSRTIVQKALQEGVGLLSEDVRGDRNLPLSATMVSLNLRSFLCVPLIGWEGKRLGVIQLDSLQQGSIFKPDDLEMLTAICLQVAVVLQNASYHAQRIREERLRQEVLLARDIQSRFLPDDFSVVGAHSELFARCWPAREVSGDLYDFFRLPDGRLLFFLGDVSGKSMPASLFMIAVRTLARHLGPTATGAADFLWRLNNALALDNPTHLYVTLLCGIYDDRDGSVRLARGGHPNPIVRTAQGTTSVVEMRPGLMLGATVLPQPGSETVQRLASGELLMLFTDGCYEATASDGKTAFGVSGLCQALEAVPPDSRLDQISDSIAQAVRLFAPGEQQDDMTLLLLRRR